MSGRLIGKTAVITGAGSGQGRTSAQLFAQEGARLALCDIDEQGLAETTASIEAAGGEVLARKVDISDVAAVEQFADAATAQFPIIDIIYNNAGIMHNSSIKDTTVADWDRIHAVNLRSSFLMVKNILPALIKSNAGVVLNVSSGAGQLGLWGLGAYSSSKGAIISLTRSQAAELACYNIRVNCIIPGAIDTPMPGMWLAALTPEQRETANARVMGRVMLERWGKPEEVSRAALFLASDEASYITGIALPVDGGYSAC